MEAMVTKGKKRERERDAKNSTSSIYDFNSSAGWGKENGAFRKKNHESSAKTI